MWNWVWTSNTIKQKKVALSNLSVYQDSNPNNNNKVIRWLTPLHFLNFTGRNWWEKSNLQLRRKKILSIEMNQYQKYFQDIWNYHDSDTLKEEPISNWNFRLKTIPAGDLMEEINTLVIENGEFEDRKKCALTGKFGLPGSRCTEYN